MSGTVLDLPILFVSLGAIPILFIKEKFECVIDLINICFCTAGESGSSSASSCADVLLYCIGFVKETLFESHCGTVTDHHITFHFTETKTSFTGTSFGRLTGKDLDRTFWTVHASW